DEQTGTAGIGDVRCHVARRGPHPPARTAQSRASRRNSGAGTVKVAHYDEVTQVPVTMEGSSGCQVRWLVDESTGAPNFAMRQFEVAPGGYTPRHSHPYEHEVFVLEGQGTVLAGDKEHPLEPGKFVLVTPGEVHQFR